MKAGWPWLGWESLPYTTVSSVDRLRRSGHPDTQSGAEEGEKGSDEVREDDSGDVE
jgi:hypothetical protein